MVKTKMLTTHTSNLDKQMVKNFKYPENDHHSGQRLFIQYSFPYKTLILFSQTLYESVWIS